MNVFLVLWAWIQYILIPSMTHFDLTIHSFIFFFQGYITPQRSLSIEEATERDKALIRSSLTDLGMRLKSISRENSLARIGKLLLMVFTLNFFPILAPFLSDF